MDVIDDSLLSYKIELRFYLTSINKKRKKENERNESNSRKLKTKSGIFKIHGTCPRRDNRAFTMRGLECSDVTVNLSKLSPSGFILAPSTLATLAFFLFLAVA